MYLKLGIFFLVMIILLLQSNYIKQTWSESADFFAGRTPYGIPLEKWAAEYWQWVATLSPDTPMDPTTQKHECLMGSDSGNQMVFLISPYEMEYSADCKIPSGKSILVPLLVGECDPTVDDARAKTGKIQDLWACAKDADEGLKSWSVKLDNKTLFQKIGDEQVNMHLLKEILVRNASSFTLNIPEVNRFEVEKGSYSAVVDGYYLILKPLPIGTHNLEYAFVQEKSTGGLKIPSGESRATYVLKVQ